MDVNLKDVQAKLMMVESMLEAGSDIRVIRAELADARAILSAKEYAMSAFPIKCQCYLKGATSPAHTKTTQAIAEQAYHNYRRYNPNGKTLADIKSNGGFGCIEIRLLLRGLNPADPDWGLGNDDGLLLHTPKLRAFLKQNLEVKL